MVINMSTGKADENKNQCCETIQRIRGLLLQIDPAQTDIESLNQVEAILAGQKLMEKPSC